MMRFIITIMIAFAFVLAIAQEEAVVVARYETDVIAPLVGDAVSLVLVVTAPVDYEVVLPDFAVIDWGAMQVIGAGEVTTVQNDLYLEYRLPLEVMIWRAGDVTTPRTMIAYFPPSQDELDNSVEAEPPGQVVTQPVFFDVVSVLDEEPSLRFNRGVFDLPYFSLRVWGTVTVFAIGVVLVGGWFVQSRHVSLKLPRVTSEKKTDVTSRTLQTLRRLELDAPDVSTLYSVVGDTLRHYALMRAELGDQEVTTDELLMVLLNTGILPETRLRELHFLLSQTDQAKFAPSEFLENKELALVEMSIRWIQAADQQFVRAGDR